eukprot:TRINITY_DN2341_c0_g1_i1.p1 TRINITY_DN2341_c0_g1~~TRINITY_DN2341_c0_g1_i1.p1  ORF type:complete len:365 (+),score=144.36 TRINITY_DN2341_c0_g1_i1:63-1157(+)
MRHRRAEERREMDGSAAATAARRRRRATATSATNSFIKFIAISLFVFLVLFSFFFLFFCKIVHQGNVGLVKSAGAFSGIVEPGIHFIIPVFRSIIELQVTLKTNALENIVCGSSSGVLVNFKRIEIVSMLDPKLVLQTVKNYTVNYDKLWITDKLRHEMNQICSRYSIRQLYIDIFPDLDEMLLESMKNSSANAPGIIIIAIRLTKPQIPKQITENYEKMEIEKTKLLISTETQKVIQQEAQIERVKAVFESQTESDVSKIRMNQLLMEQEFKRKISIIEDEIHLSHQAAIADADLYTKMKEAESGLTQYTQNYIKYELVRSISPLPKSYFGKSLLRMFTDLTYQLLGKDFIFNTTSQTSTMLN